MKSHYKVTSGEMITILNCIDHISRNALDRSCIQDDCITAVNALIGVVNRGIDE